MRISASGLLIAIFIGIVWGLKMQDDYLIQNADYQTNVVLGQAVIPIATTLPAEVMEQELNQSFSKYMKTNFDFATWKISWAQAIEDYGIKVKQEGVLITVRTNLAKKSEDSTCILNAVQGFMKSRLSHGYRQGSIVITNEKGETLVERRIILHKD
jgi:hypothetical protein